ncbi:hypothetical protein [Streptomyces sp. NBC_00079]
MAPAVLLGFGLDLVPGFAHGAPLHSTADATTAIATSAFRGG